MAEHPFMPVRRAFSRAAIRAASREGANRDQQDWRGRVQAEEGQQRYTSRTTPDVTCVTRHVQNAKPTSRCRTVAPWSIPLHHRAPGDGCYYPETDGES